MTALSQVAHSAVGRYRAYADRRWRRLPNLRVSRSTGTPTVYYLVPHVQKPQGGVRMAYRHVDILNALGFSAAILHDRRGYRPSWFESETRAVWSREVVWCADDILVVPDVYGASLGALDPDIRLVVFNQGAYFTFEALAADAAPGAPYGGIPRLERIITVSRDSAALLTHSFPDIPVQLARPVVDAAVFHRSPIRTADRTFAFVPTRRASELNQVLHMLRARGVEWMPHPLVGLTETALAEALRRSAVFVSLSDRDGFGLPPAEAMACGCYVVGYTGGGGDEFFDPQYCVPVSSTLELVRELERAMTRPREELIRAGERASEVILDRYSVENLRTDLSTIYSELI